MGLNNRGGRSCPRLVLLVLVCCVGPLAANRRNIPRRQGKSRKMGCLNQLGLRVPRKCPMESVCVCVCVYSSWPSSGRWKSKGAASGWGKKEGQNTHSHTRVEGRPGVYPSLASSIRYPCTPPHLRYYIFPAG